MFKRKKEHMGMAPRSILALVLSVPFFVLGLFLIKAGHIAVALGTLFMCCGIIIVSLFMSFPMARKIAEPWAQMIFFPSECYKEAKPMYSIPESKIAKGLYEEAIIEYQKIAAQYPEETKPYLEMISVASDHLKDPEWAKAIYQRGLKALEDDDAKEVLTRGYRAILD